MINNYIGYITFSHGRVYSYYFERKKVMYNPPNYTSNGILHSPFTTLKNTLAGVFLTVGPLPGHIGNIIDIDLMSVIAGLAGSLSIIIGIWGLNTEPINIQLSTILTYYEGQHYLTVVDLNDPSGGWLRQLFRGRIYSNFMAVQVMFQGTNYYALIPLPESAFDAGELIRLRGMETTIESVLISAIPSPDRDHWDYLEWFYNIRVYSGYGLSQRLFGPYDVQEGLEDDDGSRVIVDGTGCLIMEDAFLYSLFFY